jgi:ribosomal protein S18 acetylase RimI-like enzyme
VTAAAAQAVPLAPAQTREAGEVLARALYDDPNWLWILPDESRRAQVLPWFMKAWTGYCRRHGAAHATTGKVEGAALWIPPGKYPPSAVRLILAGMIFIPLKFGRAAFARMIRGVNYETRLHKRDVPARHWYLATLGVEPARQGRGIGSALIRPVLARADAEGLPCYVETEKERNVLFYRRHGFEVVVESDVPNGGPHMWTMKREPQG